MFEVAPDKPDFDEYEAEQERLKKMRKRHQHEWNRADMMEDEYERIKNCTE